MSNQITENALSMYLDGKKLQWYRVDMSIELEYETHVGKYRKTPFVELPISVVIEETDEVSARDKIVDNFDDLLLADPLFFEDENVKLSHKTGCSGPEICEEHLIIEKVSLATDADVEKLMGHTFLTGREERMAA